MSRQEEKNHREDKEPAASSVTARVALYEQLSPMFGHGGQKIESSGCRHTNQRPRRSRRLQRCPAQVV